MEFAIDCAVAIVCAKGEKEVKKRTKKSSKYYEELQDSDCCYERDLEELRKSWLLLSEEPNRLMNRRTAICEKNWMERAFVKEAVKRLLQTTHIKVYEIV